MAPTPGPWRLGPSGVNVVAGPEDPQGGFPHGRPVALTSSYDEPEVRLANARLIAACPRLLDALQAVEVGLQQHLDRQGDSEGRLAGLLELVAAALDQARGVTP